MIDLIGSILRGTALVILALLGMTMALAFMFSTAIAVGVLYVSARLRGKPFGIRSYWNQRSQAYHFGSARFTGASFGERRAKVNAVEVIDVHVRDVS